MSEVERAIGPDRRTFVKRLVVGTAFAAPLVASFKMTGIAAVFGDAPRSVTGGANGNTTQPPTTAQYPRDLACFIVPAKGDLDVSEPDDSVTINLFVPAGALPEDTIICLYGGDLGVISADTGSETPKSAYLVVWHSPPGNSEPDALSQITMTVLDPNVHAGDPIYMYDKSSGNLVDAGTADEGQYVVTFTLDPGFVVTTVTPSGTPATPVLAGAQTAG